MEFDIDDPDIKLRYGTLKVNFASALVKEGSFKTAHPRMVHFQDVTNPYTDRRVCVKQVYEQKVGSTAIV